jgi:hypothetical protein
MLPKTKRAIFGRLLFFDKLIGGDEGGRTPDLCNAIAALCQTELRPHFFQCFAGLTAKAE